MKKVIVFGGSGFQGSHVADKLTEYGYDVHIFDLVSSNYIKPTQKMVIGDILDIDAVSKVVKDANYVYHFAGIAGIQEANNNPVDAVKSNILGTTNILHACYKEKIERIIFASTIYVYSEHGGFYRSCKQACEMLIENYHKLYGLNYTILRFGSLYGRRANNFNWINNVIKQALTKGKIQRFGSGEEIRDYIHIKDSAQACIDILDNQYKNQYIMLTGTQTIKVKDLLRMISEIFQNKIKIEYLDERIEEHYEITPFTFRPRVAKKYMPNTQMDLGQGILDTIYDVYKELNSAEKIISPPD